jgi:cell division septum initiation protein DivIVA
MNIIKKINNFFNEKKLLKKRIEILEEKLQDAQKNIDNTNKYWKNKYYKNIKKGK